APVPGSEGEINRDELFQASHQRGSDGVRRVQWLGFDPLRLADRAVTGIICRMLNRLLTSRRRRASFQGRVAPSVALAGATLVAAIPDSAHGDWSGLLVPAYFSPSRGQDWQRLAEAAAQVPVMAIANVSNGPGTSRREDYQRAIDAVREAGGRVIGYVHTTYTRRPMAEVLADIDR